MTSRLLIVRHAERPSIPEGEVGNDLALTDEGIESTQRFANALNEKIISIQSSPILRCVQTAKLIADAQNFKQDIQTNQLLGDPGFFISDAEVAWNSWLSKGSESVNLHLLSGTETWPGFRAFDGAIADMLDHIRLALSTDETGLTVWVTHDTILATLASRVLPQPLSLASWPTFLGNLEAKIGANDRLEFSYHSPSSTS